MLGADALVRLLHLNAPANALKSGADDETYKVLVLDRVTKDIVAPLLRINDLRKCGPGPGSLTACCAAPRACAWGRG